MVQLRAEVSEDILGDGQTFKFLYVLLGAEVSEDTCGY